MLSTFHIFLAIWILYQLGFSEGKLKLRRAYSSSSPSPTASSPRMSQCFSSSLKAGRKPMSKLEGSQEFSLAQLLFYLRLQLIRWTHPHYEGQCSLVSLVIQMLVLHRTPSHTHQNNVWPDILAPCGQSRLKYKINHHRYPVL